MAPPMKKRKSPPRDLQDNSASGPPASRTRQQQNASVRSTGAPQTVSSLSGPSTGLRSRPLSTLPGPLQANDADDDFVPMAIPRPNPNALGPSSTAKLSAQIVNGSHPMWWRNRYYAPGDLGYVATIAAEQHQRRLAREASRPAATRQANRPQAVPHPPRRSARHGPLTALPAAPSLGTITTQRHVVPDTQPNHSQGKRKRTTRSPSPKPHTSDSAKPETKKLRTWRNYDTAYPSNKELLWQAGLGSCPGNFNSPRALGDPPLSVAEISERLKLNGNIPHWSTTSKRIKEAFLKAGGTAAQLSKKRKEAKQEMKKGTGYGETNTEQSKPAVSLRSADSVPFRNLTSRGRQPDVVPTADSRRKPRADTTVAPTSQQHPARIAVPQNLVPLVNMESPDYLVPGHPLVPLYQWWDSMRPTRIRSPVLPPAVPNRGLPLRPRGQARSRPATNLRGRGKFSMTIRAPQPSTSSGLQALPVSVTRAPPRIDYEDPNELKDKGDENTNWACPYCTKVTWPFSNMRAHVRMRHPRQTTWINPRRLTDVEVESYTWPYRTAEEIARTMRGEKLTDDEDEEEEEEEEQQRDKADDEEEEEEEEDLYAEPQ